MDFGEAIPLQYSDFCYGFLKTYPILFWIYKLIYFLILLLHIVNIVQCISNYVLEL